MPPRNLDLDRALLDPSAVFRAPEEVIQHPALTRHQKIEILRRWAYDATELLIADDENMPPGEEPLLDRIHQALDTLTSP